MMWRRTPYNKARFPRRCGRPGGTLKFPWDVGKRGGNLVEQWPKPWNVRKVCMGSSVGHSGGSAFFPCDHQSHKKLVYLPAWEQREHLSFVKQSPFFNLPVSVLYAKKTDPLTARACHSKKHGWHNIYLLSQDSWLKLCVKLRQLYSTWAVIGPILNETSVIFSSSLCFAIWKND